MKLEDQVCSLELAKRLKELGFKQTGLFCWVEKFPVFNDRGPILVSVDEMLKWRERMTVDVMRATQDVIFSAFTVAELGEMLPAWVISQKCGGGEFTTNSYWLCEEGVRHENFKQSTEADARAKMLIYLIERKLTDAKERKSE